MVIVGVLSVIFWVFWWLLVVVCVRLVMMCGEFWSLGGGRPIVMCIRRWDAG